MTEIANTVDEKGKAVYSNDVKRQAELERRKQASPEYQKMQNELKEQKFDYDMTVTTSSKGCWTNKENTRALARIEGVA